MRELLSHRPRRAAGTAGRALVAASLAAAGLVPFVAPAADAGGCANVHHGRGWATIGLPSGTWSDFAAAPGVRDRLFATDGTQIVRTVDGGCHWSRVYGLRDDLVGTNDPWTAVATYTIAQLATAHAGTVKASRYVYALVLETTASSLSAQLPVVVVASSDGGRTWQPMWSAPGLQAPDTPRCDEGALGTTRLSVAPADPRTLYLFCNGYGLAEAFTFSYCPARLFVSHDRGATWAADMPEFSPARLDCWAAPTNLVVDPRNRSVLYAVQTVTAGGTPLSRSSDGGRSWKPVKGAQIKNAALIDMQYAAGSGHPLIAACGSTAVYESRDGGRTARTLPPTPLASWQRRQSFDCVLSGAGGALAVSQQLRERDNSTAVRAFVFVQRTGRWRTLPKPPRTDLLPHGLSNFYSTPSYLVGDYRGPVGTFYAFATGTTSSPDRIVRWG